MSEPLSFTQPPAVTLNPSGRVPLAAVIEFATSAATTVTLTVRDDDREWTADFDAAGTILCFDNGTYRARPFAKKQPSAESYSRAVEYEVDEAAMTVKQVWDYGRTQSPHYFATFVSGAVWLPESGNSFVDFGGLMSDEDGIATDDPGKDCGWVRMAEVTHEAEPEVVFEFFIDERPNRGWDSYRGQRIANFFD